MHKNVSSVKTIDVPKRVSIGDIIYVQIEWLKGPEIEPWGTQNFYVEGIRLFAMCSVFYSLGRVFTHLNTVFYDMAGGLGILTAE